MGQQGPVVVTGNLTVMVQEVEVEDARRVALPAGPPKRVLDSMQRGHEILRCQRAGQLGHAINIVWLIRRRPGRGFEPARAPQQCDRRLRSNLRQRGLQDQSALAVTGTWQMFPL